MSPLRAIARLSLFACATSLLIIGHNSAAQDVGLDHSAQRMPAGYSIGNFGIAASMGDDGLHIARSLINPPVLGQWLQAYGHGQLSLAMGGGNDFVVRDRYSVFPQNSVDLSSKSMAVGAHVDTFAPIGAMQGGATSIDSFIPAIIVRVELRNDGSSPQSVGLSYSFSVPKAHSEVLTERFRHDEAEVREVHQSVGDAEAWLMSVSMVGESIVCNPVEKSPPGIHRPLHLSAQINLKPHQITVFTFVVGNYNSRGYPARELSSRHSMQEYLLAKGLQGQSNGLKQELAEFVSMLPKTGDADLDLYSRWYLSAAVLLTKGLATGEVLTMGYTELNQRDSFWTSGAHLIYWPDLELRMLRESMSFQQPSGQIPMTILPVIERENNIDGNEYFILRIARYYHWTRDASFLAEALPHVRRAIEYLESLDRDKIGVPQQASYWADWKDVQGVEGRTYAPHFSLLWLAALKASRQLADAASDTGWAEHLDALYATAQERINRDVSEGGLWQRTHYVDRWQDGRQTPYLLEDQTVAGIFDVIPHDRLESIYALLDGSSESSVGVRETYPYIAGFKQPYGAGEYHNGGVWPWLNFADAWGRFLNGHAADAERIMKKVAYHDLVHYNDFSPSEFLQGDTGKNIGFAVQGWDADWLSAIYFGAFGLDRISADELAVHLNLTNHQDFSTAIRIPEGTVWLKRVSGQISVEQSLSRPIRVRVIQAATGPEPQAGGNAIESGDIAPTRRVEKQSVLLILLDGARWDLLSTNDVPHLTQLAQPGVLGEMIPVWPTISAPNHWALATGLYPEHSGPYSNEYFEPKSGKYIDWQDDTSWLGEPIWTAVARQGDISGVIGYWAGALNMVGTASKPSYFIPYDKKCAHCADMALQLLDQDEETRPRLLALYSLEPDELQHMHGVGSREAKAAIRNIDGMIGELTAGLASRGLSDKVDIIIVADHGQSNILPTEQAYYLDELVDLNDLMNPPKLGPFVALWPKAGKEEHVYEQLKKVGAHAHVYRSGELPLRWHCCESAHAPPIILMTDPGWSIELKSSANKRAAVQGAHGYDNAVRDMHSLFIASGPAIRAGARVDPFENVDVYSLIAEILKIEPAKTDGSLRPLCAILVDPPPSCL